MESPKGQEGSGMEEMLMKFAGAHPEYADLSRDEIRQAAGLIAAQDAAVDEEMLERALQARKAVRTSGEVPVISDRDQVITMASPDDVARKYAEDKAGRIERREI